MNYLKTEELQEITGRDIRCFHQSFLYGFDQSLSLVVGIFFDSFLQEQKIWSDFTQIIELVDKSVDKLFVEVKALNR